MVYIVLKDVSVQQQVSVEIHQISQIHNFLFGNVKCV